MSDQEGHVQDIEKLVDQEQEVVRDDREAEANPDLDTEVSLDHVRVVSQGRKQDLDHVLVQKDLEVHLPAVHPDQSQNRDRDRNRRTEVTQEIVIVGGIIHRQSRYRNLDPELNHNPDLDQDQGVSPDANDLVASKIKYQHCQGMIRVSGNTGHPNNCSVIHFNINFKLTFAWKIVFHSLDLFCRYYRRHSCTTITGISCIMS